MGVEGPIVIQRIRLWWAYVLFFLVKLTRPAPITPIAKFGRKDMMQIAHQIFGARSRYLETASASPDGRFPNGTTGTVFARGYLPMSVWWAYNQEAAGRAELVRRVRSPWYRIKHRWGRG